jgi:hypothetical protein
MEEAKPLIQARGFIGADQLFLKKAGLLTVPGVVFFLVDLITTMFGVVYVYSLIANVAAPIWIYVIGMVVALYAIYIQVTIGSVLWYSIMHRGEIVTKTVTDKKMGERELQYEVEVDWADVTLYLTHALPDLVSTTLFFWAVIAYPILSNPSLSDGKPLGGAARAIGVASCVLIALLCSIMPVVTLIRGAAKQAKGAESVE